MYKFNFRIFTVFIIILITLGSSAHSGHKNKKAKNFKLKKIDSKESYSLKDFSNQPVILNFWASWCTPCKDEMPFLEDFWKDYKDKGIKLIGINVMDNNKSAIKLLESLNITYLNLSDPPGKVTTSYKIIGLPVTIFIDKNGNISHLNYGPYIGDEGKKKFYSELDKIL